jgi:hypothetical protein
MTASDLTTWNAISLMLFLIAGNRVKRPWQTLWLAGMCCTGIWALAEGTHA